MELERGFQIEVPDVFVPWGATEQELLDLLPSPPRRVTHGYHTLDATVLSGLMLTIGFHFEPRRDGTLHELAFFRIEPAELSVSFARHQRHLDLTFGPPHVTTKKPRWYPTHEWSFGDVSVKHWAQVRFVHEEHIRIKRT